MASKKHDSQVKAYMGEDAVFNGSLAFSGTVRIDGRFEGQVSTEDTLIVGENGRLVADINAGTVICKGRIEGNIIATQRVEIHADSRIIGTIKSPALFVDVGGILDGKCDMSGNGKNVVKLLKKENLEAEASG